MKKDIFSIPIFEDKVDLEKLIVPYTDNDFKPTWDSSLATTLQSPLDVPESTYQYLYKIVVDNLGPFGLLGSKLKFDGPWVNKYLEYDYQDVHIHPHAQWSFIIYVDVYSKTSFLNPSMGMIQNHMGSFVPNFELDYKPNLEPGSIIIFPSYLMHHVNSGNIGTTMSGNVLIDYER
mgnify:FL=1|tara:strand:+ start:60 stop:587 length:528 start_codon:yes stop_codon:yes gene_type:complete